MPRFPLRKVPGKAAYLHHLLDFVMSGPASVPSPAGLIGKVITVSCLKDNHCRHIADYMYNYAE